MSFEIPLDSGNSNRIENVELIPVGMNLCTLYGVADLGTQATKFGNKRMIKLMFEFPLEKRIFWEGDEPKPSVISTEETMSLAEKSNLRKRWIEPMANVKLAKEEGFDPTTLLGKNYVATVTHSPDGKWANIASISPLDERNMKLFDLTSPSYPSTNDLFKFHLNDTFDSDLFAALPKNIRGKLRESVEGEQHQKSGGVFKEPEQTQGTNGTAAGGMGTSGKKLVMKPDAPYQYDALKGMNWTDDQIVDKGYAVWQQATPPPAAAAAPSAPSAPAAPQTPPPADLPPAQPKHKVVMKDPTQADKIDNWLSKGWTYELLVQHNHADWV